MTCLNDKQIERLVERPNDPGNARFRSHVDTCSKCRERFDDAAADANLINDVRELRERRADIEPLLEEMTGTGDRAKYSTDRV